VRLTLAFVPGLVPELLSAGEFYLSSFCVDIKVNPGNGCYSASVLLNAWNSSE
jgi:hypothetical protein